MYCHVAFDIIQQLIHLFGACQLTLLLYRQCQLTLLLLLRVLQKVSADSAECASECQLTVVNYLDAVN